MAVKTNDIVKGDHNKEYMVNLSEILTWYPADYVHICGRCPIDCLYHTCISIELQWQYVLHNIIYPDEHYADVYQSIKKHGFVAQLRAKITEDDHVILLDGHNRVGVALDMSLKAIPVYVGDINSTLDDLKAPDSGWWQKHNKPWSTILGK